MSAVSTPKDFRTKISSCSTLLEKLKAEIQEYESLPVVHGNLQEKIRSLARVLYFLQINAYARQDDRAIEKELSVLDEDLQILNQR
jgi:hypothetical protein